MKTQTKTQTKTQAPMTKDEMFEIKMQIHNAKIIAQGTADHGSMKGLACFNLEVFVPRFGKTFIFTAEKKSLAAFLTLQAERAQKELTDKGFKMTSSSLAGMWSGSTWINPKTLETAEVLVRNMHRITYKR